MFFQNVDAIVGPDEPIVYPEHLTKELDYALEFAVVLKKFVQLRQKDRIVVFLYEGKTFRIVGV
jgi:2-keto-4-pentenoate hydratase/2-oxohepta-3-ene-1,7-dioic acid hydratase in catechol pathway